MRIRMMNRMRIPMRIPMRISMRIAIGLQLDSYTMSMGFLEKKCKKALLSCDNNLERASDWLFSHMDDEVSDSEMQGDVQGGEPKYKCSSG